MIRRERRVLPFDFGKGTQITYQSQPCRTQLGVVSRTTRSLGIEQGSQVTDSEAHQEWGSKLSPLSDVGGDFYTRRQYVTGPKSHVRLDTGVTDNCPFSSDRTVYIGSCYSMIPGLVVLAGGWPTDIASTTATLTALGATAVARVKPADPTANTSLFLLELLRDGIPRHTLALMKERTRAAKAAGDDYLNVQFGWAPIVSDVKDIARSLLHADDLIRQYERDAGRVVRRRYQFPSRVETQFSIVPWDRFPFVANGMINSRYWSPTTWNLERVREITQNRWFSGAFTYYLPTDYSRQKSVKGLLAKADQLLGMEITPETLWDLAPWSWALDWFSNIGNVMSNISSFSKGLVMRYGYMMESTIVKDTYTSVDKSLQTSPVSFVIETKQRVKANPFGFGVTWSGLSPFQLSIAGALGLTRGHKQAR